MGQDGWRIPANKIQRPGSNTTAGASGRHSLQTDQGSQFTSDDFTGVLKGNDIKISMDGKGRWTDNVLIELLWW